MVNKNMNILVRFNPQYGRCPQCKTVGHLRRSRSRNMREQILRKTGILKIYRCSECGWRGFRSTLVITKKSIRMAFFYIILILLTVMIASTVIKKISL
jgi:uncharacterized protein with PIN domain